MGCCNVRVLSLIVAWFTTIVSAIFFFGLLGFACIIDHEFAEEEHLNESELTILFVACILGCLVAALTFAFCVMLLVGIYQDRYRLMMPYVYLFYIMFVLGSFVILAVFVYDLVDHQPAGDVFLGLIRNIIYLAFDIILFSPIYLLYQKMRKGPVLPEHHSLSNNEPVNKSLYGGQI
ncbi:uncharacterized protein LOC106088047 [Stomoxys calcitrans]|uniref:Uncharacterized protein n=1 Tax=Stomoxys calcitrans TaxID=35570 RepID=A0A1I8Q7G7_STOCA|nr:uncharacterized protein LOC106088047 [Stomoxys calcitrans]